MSDNEISKWDIALAGMAREEYHKTAAPLQLADFRRLAKEYAIRLDDIMVTMFELAIHGEWVYQDAQGVDQRFERETLDNLYVNGRLKDEDLAVFTGNWRPIE